MSNSNYENSLMDFEERLNKLSEELVRMRIELNNAMHETRRIRTIPDPPSPGKKSNGFT